jgi:hypothetical protein
MDCGLCEMMAFELPRLSSMETTNPICCLEFLMNLSCFENGELHRSRSSAVVTDNCDSHWEVRCLASCDAKTHRPQMGHLLLVRRRIGVALAIQTLGHVQWHCLPIAIRPASVAPTAMVPPFLQHHLPYMRGVLRSRLRLPHVADCTASGFHRCFYLGLEPHRGSHRSMLQ